MAAEGTSPAKLMYGYEDTDVVYLAFACQPGTGLAKIEFYPPNAPKPTDNLDLWSGGHRQTFTLSRTDDLDSLTLEAGIDPDSPVAVSFARTGQLVSYTGPYRILIDAQTNRERGRVAEFWHVCRRPKR